MSRSRGVFRGFRLHIGLFGRRNVGKSSVLNALTRQAVSIVSDVAGTTTDPVEKPMELLPIGPVLFIDTAGIDDEGALGALRVDKTRRAIDRTDLAVVVTDGPWGAFEQELWDRFAELDTPCIAVHNKCDLGPPSDALEAVSRTDPQRVVSVSATEGIGIDRLKEALVRHAPDEFLGQTPIVADLVPPGGTAVLVVPIDKEAPKGRLILPQVQTIRDLLDHDAAALVVKERELAAVLSKFTDPVDLVVTDSQAFLKVAADTPRSVPMTSFSILFSRFKGDLGTLAQGALAIDALRPGDRVLVAEACTHHPIGEDIARVKIPRWLTQYVGGALHFDTVSGKDFPDDLSAYSLVVHCGGCMLNRKAMLVRMYRARAAGVPMTNFGMLIAYSQGIFGRALAPFPGVLAQLEAAGWKGP